MRNSLRDIVRHVLREDTAAQGFGLSVYGRDSSSSPPGGDDEQDSAPLNASGQADEPQVDAKDEKEWREKVLSFAKRLTGTPYTWGGNYPGQGLDCSGLVYYVFRQTGLVPNMQDMGAGGEMDMGRPIKQSELKPGDLVGFKTNGAPSHIGFYLGSGSQYLSALGGGSETKMGEPKMKKSGKTPSVMEANFDFDDRVKYFASIDALIAKRVAATAPKTPAAPAVASATPSAEKDQQQKGEDKKKA